MRVPFSQVFAVAVNGSVSPRVPVSVNGISMGPGVSFGTGVSFGGVDLAGLNGQDLEVDIQQGVYVLTGHYQ